ncbi:MAG TPA: glycoside hydrolase family 15 protein, partial [Armatimonadota bacterium]
IDSGYIEAPRRFFSFCHAVITDEGYLLHKYNADGSLASSWHGWYHDGQKELPIQEDETALVLWALWRHYQRFRDVEYIKPLFRGLIVRAANWMLSYRDPETGLPLPSWDLWEERRGVFAWTVGATWGGLQAAANFAEAFGEDNLAQQYRQACAAMQSATERLFWDDAEQCYARMVRLQDDGAVERDMTAESSLFGLCYFGMIAPDAPRMRATMLRMRERLSVQTQIGGIARYQHDQYYRVRDDAQVPGNPWFICTLWLAQWYIEMAHEQADLVQALGLLHWATDHALASGVMGEQVHPYTGESLSVSPLTWSHATFVLVVHEYLDRLRACRKKPKDSAEDAPGSDLCID